MMKYNWEKYSKAQEFDLHRRLAKVAVLFTVAGVSLYLSVIESKELWFRAGIRASDRAIHEAGLWEKFQELYDEKNK